MLRKPLLYDPLAAQRLYDNWQVDTLSYGAEGTLEQLRETSVGLLLRSGEIQQAKEGKPLSEAEWAVSVHYRPGLDYEEGMTEELAKLQAEAWDRVQIQSKTSERATVAQEVARFGMSMFGALPDPINGIPFGTALKGAKFMGKYAVTELRKRMAVSAAEGFAGTAILQPGIAYVRGQLQQDYTAGDAALDLAVGTGLGTILGTGAHLIGSKAKKYRESLTVDKQLEDAVEAVDVVTEDPFGETRTVNAPPPRPEQITPAPYRADAPGSNTVFVGDAQVPVKTRLVVKDLSEVIASHNDDGTVNPDYNPEYQPRQERGEPVMMDEVERDARALNPDLLGESKVPQLGAPITLGGQVLSGNGRLMKIRRAALKYPERYANYKEALRQAGFKVGDIETPVLVRELEVGEKFDAVRFAEDSNLDLATQMTEAEIALRDSKRMDDVALRNLTSDDIYSSANQKTLAGVAGRIFSRGELNSILDKTGKLNAVGKQRMANAIFVKAFGDYHLINSALGKKGEELKNIFTSMTKVAIPLAKLRAMMDTGRVYSMDLHEDIRRVLKEIYSLLDREQPITLKERLEEIIGPKQDSLFGDQMTQISGDLNAKQVRLLQLFDEFRNAPDQAATIIKTLTKEIEDLGDATQMDLLDAKSIPQLGTIIEKVVGDALVDSKVKKQLDALRQEIADRLGVKLRKSDLEPHKNTSAALLAQYREALAQQREELIQGMELEGPKATEDNIDFTSRAPETPEPMPELKNLTPEQADYVQQRMDEEIEAVQDDLFPEELEAIRKADEEAEYFEQYARQYEETANCVMRNG